MRMQLDPQISFDDSDNVFDDSPERHEHLRISYYAEIIQ